MGTIYVCTLVGEQKRRTSLLRGWDVGLVKPTRGPTQTCGLGFQVLGVQRVLVRRRDHALCLQGCGGGAPSQFWNLLGEGGSLRPLMSARKMCICSHFGRGALYALLCLLGTCVSVRILGGGLFTPSYVCSENVYLLAFWEGGSLRPLMSARKMCICSHKNGKGILTYYRGGVLVGDGNRVGDLWPAALLACAEPPRPRGAS